MSSISELNTDAEQCCPTGENFPAAASGQRGGTGDSSRMEALQAGDLRIQTGQSRISARKQDLGCAEN